MEHDKEICQKIDEGIMEHIFYLRKEIQNILAYARRLEERICDNEREIFLLKPKNF